MLRGWRVRKRSIRWAMVRPVSTMSSTMSTSSWSMGRDEVLRDLHDAARLRALAVGADAEEVDAERQVDARA